MRCENLYILEDLPMLSKEFRLERQISQMKMAELCPISCETYRRFENGKTVNADTLYKIAEVMHVKVILNK